MKIYTRGGDRGKTGIYGGERVDKDSPRIEANGDLDELNSAIGVVRSQLPAGHHFQETLRRIQIELMNAMSQVATPSAMREKNENPLSEDLVAFCEKEIDAMESYCDANGADNGYFILPGGSEVSASLHMARCIARRAERRLWTLHREDPLPEPLLTFVNRLSDLLFAMARMEQCESGLDEERWRSFAYKFGEK